MKLSAETRLRVCGLLDDGETYDAVRSDPDIDAECREKELTIHNSSFAAYRKSHEFDEYRRRRREWSEEFERRRMAAAIVRADGSIDDLADMASFELTRKALDGLAEGDISPGDLAALARTVKTAGEKAWEKEKSEMAARIAELSSKIIELNEKLTGQRGTGGLSEEAVRRIEEAAGLL
jgi:transposase-like protein